MSALAISLIGLLVASLVIPRLMQVGKNDLDQHFK